MTGCGADVTALAKIVSSAWFVESYNNFRETFYHPALVSSRICVTDRIKEFKAEWMEHISDEHYKIGNLL
jgi:hypothetical protein